jgi:3-phenylpropionate/trans-cinnamate dioxygenase alpha subunit
MTLDEVSDFVSLERGEVSRRIFSDPEIFDAEMELIFGRAWLFLAHDSMIPKSGDFFEAPMGKDNVLVVRQRDGSVKALLNTCTHRGNAVCRAEEGNTKNFMCTYHGWTFAISGELIGVPGFENLYHSELDKASLGLREVAQIDTYKGFIFGTMDPTAPPLEEFLGATGRLGLDLIAARGDMEVIPGIQKYVIDCNWKFAVDNLFDWYHPQITHMSAFTSGVMPNNAQRVAAQQAREVETEEQRARRVIDRGGAETPDGKELEIPSGPGTLDSIVVIGEFGHAIAGPALSALAAAFNNEWRKREEARTTLGPVGIEVAGHPNIFPNAWITTSPQISLRVPRTPTSTEMWFFSFVDKNATAEERAMAVHRSNHVFGPAGLLEQEDGENWSQSTRQTMGLKSREIPQAIKMNLGRGKVIREQGLARVEANTTEHAQLWTYASWAQWMKNPTWDELKAATLPPDVL